MSHSFVTPRTCRPPDFSVHGISQARILEWVAIPFSRGSIQGWNLGLPYCVQIWYHLSHLESLWCGRLPGLGRSPGEGKGNPLQYSCLRNPMDRGARWSTFHRVSKSQTQLSTHAWHQAWSPSQGTSVMLRAWT